MADKTRIAIAIGDPAGIGPEISLKVARDPSVRRACSPILVGDARILQCHAAACRIPVDLRVIARVQDVDWSAERNLDRARLYRVRRLSRVRRARDRNGGGRRLPDALLRPSEVRTCQSPP